MATLFEKVTIGGVELKNRLVVTPMGFTAFDSDGGISDRMRNYFVERAKGGFGLIFPPAHFVSLKFEHPETNALENWNQGIRLGICVDQIHQYGAKFCMQLSLGLGRVNFVDPYTAPRSSSRNPSHWFPNLICEPLTKEDISYLIERFGYSALLAKNAGCDMVEIHAYGGYLIDQFISSIWNKRTDEYGGSLENRLRIVFELRDAVWKTCGKDYPIAIKITPDHAFPGGRTLEEGIEMVKILDEAGFCLLHLDMGAYECWFNSVTTAYQKEGLQLYIAEAVKKAGVKTPLLVQGKLDNPELAEKVAAEGIAELVGLGHGSIADPYWPKKVQAGAIDDITPCIGCNECIRHAYANDFPACAVNPLYAYEKEYVLTPAVKKESILVVGGGPGGMVSAVTAAKRGYDVELWEKEYSLGGALKAAGAPDFKFNTYRYMDHLQKQVYKHNITVRLNKTATVEDILKFNPDVVILTAGANPIIPNLPGSENGNVVEATALLSKNLPTGEKVVVLGGGLVGCETALMLDQQGKDVTIVEMLDQLLLTADDAPNSAQAIRDLLAKSNLKILTGAKLTAVDKDKAIITVDGEKKEIPCDTLVLSVGFKADHSLSKALEGKIKKVFTLGDNEKPGKILNAVHDGFHTIRLLEDL